MAAAGPDGRPTCPFTLKLFYRTGAFHRLDEFAAADQLPHVSVHTFPTCTLNDLTHYLAAVAEPALLPSPAIGTRVAFRLIYADTRRMFDAGPENGRLAGLESRGPSGAQRFLARDIGNVVIGGANGPGAPTSLDAVDGYVIGDVLVDDEDIIKRDETYQGQHPRAGAVTGAAADDTEAGNRTLAGTRFAVGDYISCAILPPLANGCVAPASDARSGRGSGVGEAPPSRMPPPNNFGASGWRNDFRTGRKGRNGMAGVSGAGVLTGDWHRGDSLPEDGGVWVRDGGRAGGGGAGGSSGGHGGRGRRRESRGGRW